MQAIVLYKTMTGSTQKYAEIISEKLSADIFPLDGVRSNEMKNYDTVIFGGCVHGGSISGLNKFKRIAEKCEKAKLAVFAVGASADNDKTNGDLLTKNFPEGTEKMKFFYFQGGFDLSRMKQPFRGLMKWVKRMVEQNPNKKPDEVEFLKMFETADDPVSVKNAEELIRYVRNS